VSAENSDLRMGCGISGEQVTTRRRRYVIQRLVCTLKMNVADPKTQDSKPSYDMSTEAVLGMIAQ
jgi:hypothetical protein